MAGDELRTAGDRFDRLTGWFDGLPGVRKTTPSTIVETTPILGGTVSLIVQTFRTDDGDYVFLQTIDAEGRARLVIPPKAVAAIVRQHDALTKASRRAAGRERWASLSPAQRKAATARLRKAGKR